MSDIHTKLSRRGAGILLPISALPSPYGIGTLGKEAFRFIDFLKKAGQKYWQVLPVGPTSYGDSPYQGFSAFAGNPYFIDLDLLKEEGLLTKEDLDAGEWGEKNDHIEYALLYAKRFSILRKAFSSSRHESTEEYAVFCETNRFWLDAYALFMSCKGYFQDGPWQEWPLPLRLCTEKAVKEYSVLLEKEIRFWKFCQFTFFSQWKALKKYANQNGICLIGDIPIYMAMDSADVWANSNWFQLDSEKKPTNVAGVPPDAFAAEGQLWGNPLYDWEAMEKSGFQWWKERMRISARLYDCVRIDHFIGICQYFSIPAEDTTARNGTYRQGPGMRLIQALKESAGSCEIIAEDLGVMLPQVQYLLRETGYPGMKVLQFAFDGRAENDHLPYMYEKNLVAYAGTHDNNTLVGWYESLSEQEKETPSLFLGICDSEEISVAALRILYASCANTVIFQAQDLLGLPETARMNFPSTTGGNWCWRLLPEQLTDGLAESLRQLAAVFGR